MSDGYSGPVDIEVWSMPTDTSDPGTVTIDMWDSPDDEQASVELRIEQAYARELGVRLIEAVGQIRDSRPDNEHDRSEVGSDDYDQEPST
jgi:hypothetical protein